MNSALLSMLDSEKITEVTNTSDTLTKVLMLMEISAVVLFVTLYWVA